MELRERVESCLKCAIHYRTIEVQFCDELTGEEITEIERRGFSIRPNMAFTGKGSWMIKLERE
jgi:hypothetical protein